MISRLSGLAVVTWALGAAPALADARWLAYDSAEADGATVPRVEFGTPETNALTFVATCSGAIRSVVYVALYVEVGGHAAGERVTIGLKTPRFDETRPGEVASDRFGRHVAAQIARNDDVWGILMAETESRVGVAGLPAAEMHLNGSRVALTQFLASCDRVWAGEFGPGPLGPPAGGAPAPLASDGPLFRTGARSIPAYSSYRWGIALDPLPPGTTLTATGRTGTVDGDAWLEVSSDGVPPRTVWVLRTDLAAEPGDTGAYLNPEESASLLMLAEPKPDAPVVGVIPPRGTGIIDLGQREGDWVLVRFGSGEGWVAHARLRPLLDPPPMVAAPGQQPAPPAATAPPEPYTQDHGAWHVDCDPCRAPAEGATCRIVAQAVATVRSRGTLTLDAPEVPVPGTVVDERRPPLGPAGRYRTGFAMPGPNDGGKLTLAIDDADPVTPPVWALDPSGEAAVILPSTVEPLLDDLRTAHRVTLTVSDGTRSWADSFNLAGFAAAYADMTGRLPFPQLYFDATACPAAQPAADQTPPAAGNPDAGTPPADSPPT